MVEENLLHLKLKLAATLDNIHLQMVMLEEEEVLLEEEEAKVEEENSNVKNVTNWDTYPMNFLRMRGQTKEMPLFLRHKWKEHKFQRHRIHLQEESLW